MLVVVLKRWESISRVKCTGIILPNMSGEISPRSNNASTPSEDDGDADGTRPIPDSDAIDDEGYAIGSGRSGVVRQIDHDDFDPVGTLVLIAIYMAIVGVMWVFMYFVEFLGGDLTVIG
jgi:hypothetical protein